MRSRLRLRIRSRWKHAIDKSASRTSTSGWSDGSIPPLRDQPATPDRGVLNEHRHNRLAGGNSSCPASWPPCCLALGSGCCSRHCRNAVVEVSRPAMPPNRYRGPPMTLQNMRAQGERWTRPARVDFTTLKNVFGRSRNRSAPGTRAAPAPLAPFPGLPPPTRRTARLPEASIPELNSEA